MRKMPETRKMITKLSPEDTNAVRVRSEILEMKDREMTLLKNENKLFLTALLSKLGLDPQKPYYIDPDANLFEIINDDGNKAVV